MHSMQPLQTLLGFCIIIMIIILPDDNTKVVIGGTLGVLVALVTIVAGVLLIFVIVLAM